MIIKCKSSANKRLLSYFVIINAKNFFHIICQVFHSDFSLDLEIQVLQLQQQLFNFHIFLVRRVKNDTLVLSKISRSQMGNYLCIASNRYSPLVSHSIMVNINCKYNEIPYIMALFLLFSFDINGTRYTKSYFQLQFDQ